jgi:hypothetical protein
MTDEHIEKHIQEHILVTKAFEKVAAHIDAARRLVSDYQDYFPDDANGIIEELDPREVEDDGLE